MATDRATQPHRRFNPLTGEWILLSPHRAQRPWQGKKEALDTDKRLAYDPQCYLCPGNTRMNGETNERYGHTYVFDNDFKAIVDCKEPWEANEYDLFRSASADGTCRVICFSGKHNLTLAEMEQAELLHVVDLWKKQMAELSLKYTWVQIFENKGEIMGCSNPHPHGQIWASDFVPEEPAKEDLFQRDYSNKHGKNLLISYAEMEQQKKERIVAENDEWICLVPYWATWPFETLLIPKKHTLQLHHLNERQSEGLAHIMKELLVRYDNLFNTLFPYSMGWHGAPANGADNDHWQLHAHYYPPLLRSADIKKFMVGFEMLGCPQRDILPETAAEMIRTRSNVHFLKNNA